MGFLQYAYQMREMHDLYQFSPPSIKKGEYYHKAYWVIWDKYFTEDEIHTETREGPPNLLRDKIEYKYKYYCVLPHE